MDISGTNPMLYAFFDEAGALRREANDVLVIPHAGRCTTTCAFRKLYPNVMVMQARQDWDGYNDPGPLHCPT